jgi:hypothetical protein
MADEVRIGKLPMADSIEVVVYGDDTIGIRDVVSRHLFLLLDAVSAAKVSGAIDAALQELSSIQEGRKAALDRATKGKR